MLERIEIFMRREHRPEISTRCRTPHLSLSISKYKGNPNLITDLPLSTLFRLGGQL